MDKINSNSVSNENIKLRRRGLNGKSINQNLRGTKIKYCSLISTSDDRQQMSATINATKLTTSTMFPDYHNDLTTTISTPTKTLLSHKTISTTTKTPSFKRSLSESSADEANRSCETTAKEGSILRKMWQNELSINPDSIDAQPITQRRQRQQMNKNIDSVLVDSNKNVQKMSSHYISDITDVGIRILLVLIFITLETTKAFHRNIHIEELWLYKNPRTDDFVTPRDLVLSVILSPLVVSLLHYFLTKDRRDFRAANWAWTLSLCLNGITTSLIKITSGRPRPDFFYRCFPDGQMMANVTPTAVNFNCTGNWRVINEGYKSFPSGHASFAFCSFGFIAFYLAGKLHVFNRVGRGESWRLFATVSPLWLAMLIGISRTCDYHHHWQDVLVGGIIGIIVAYITYRQYYPSIFSRNCHRPLPRDGSYSNCHSLSFKNAYTRLKCDDTDENDDEINTFGENGHLNISEDQLPLISDDDQMQRS